MLKRLLLGLLIAGPCLTFAQKKLKIGSQVPDLFFAQVLNTKAKTAKLSDYKGKLVILDLWSTTCTACVGAFPHMQDLQKKFGNQIQILLVNPYTGTYDTEARVRTVLDLFKDRTGFYPSLPISIKAGILNKYFPRQSVPHEIWIDGDSKLLAITEMAEVTPEHIQAYLNKERLSLPEKNDWAFDKAQPMKTGQQDFVYRALFSLYKGGIGYASGVRLNANKEVTGIYMLNKPLSQFIESAYAEIINEFQPNRIMFDTDSLKRFQVNYSYDLTIPPINPAKFDITDHLKIALQQAFGISIHRENRKINCWVLTASNVNSGSKYEARKVDLQTSSLKKFIHHVPMDQLAKLLDRFEIPLINEIQQTDFMDIDFPDQFDITDRSLLRKYLISLGFGIREEVREVPVVVITDKN